MEKLKNNLLEDMEAVSILIGFMIGVSILALPNAVTKDGKQDGWISVIIGGLYPMFMSLLSIYYVKKHPNEDILVLSKKYLGNILGTLCNILFAAQFGLYFILVVNGTINVFRVYATSFLTPIKLFISTILLVFYVSNKEIKIIAKMNKIGFYSIVMLTLTLLTALQKGNHLNILPIFGQGYKNIFKASINSAFSCAGMESIFLLYPLIRNKDKIKNITLKATFITIIIYTWVTFISIYYLGYIVTTKTLWPVLLVTEGVNLPVLNSFRFLFLFLWSIAIFNVLTNEQYLFTYIVSDVLKIKDKKKLYWFTIPISIYLCLQVGNEIQRRNIIDYIIPKVTLFNIGYVSIIALLIFIKDKMGKIESS